MIQNKKYSENSYAKYLGMFYAYNCRSVYVKVFVLLKIIRVPFTEKYACTELKKSHF